VAALAAVALVAGFLTIIMCVAWFTALSVTLVSK
jgi:hypothetical protein